MGLQVVQLIKEVTYNVTPASPVTGTVADIFLPMGDAMTVRTMPQFWQIRDAGQGNRLVRSNVGRKQVGGSLSSYLFPSEAPLMLTLAAGLTGTNPCYDLPSFTINNAIYADSTCAVAYKRYTGNKIGKFSISCDDSDQGCLTSIKAEIIGSLSPVITSTDFAIPSLSAYPPDDPYLFYNTGEGSGKLFIGSARHDYKNLTISIDNMLKPFGGEQRYNQRVGYFGRTITFSCTLLYVGQADRTAYEAGTKQSIQVEFDNGTHTLLMDFGTVNNIDVVTDSFPLDNYFTQTLSFTALVDPTITIPTDLTITTT